jgi:hypothetical protein
MKRASHIVVGSVVLLSICAAELVACSGGPAQNPDPSGVPSNCVPLLYVTPFPDSERSDCVA